MIESEVDVLKDNAAARAFWVSVGFAPRSLTLELDRER